MTYGQTKEVIRDICTPCTVYDIKKANKEIKKILGDNLMQIRKVDDEFGNPLVYYEVFCEDSCYTIRYDFWNSILEDF